MDVVTLHVCTVHVVQYICTYITYVVFGCQTRVLYIQMYVSPCVCICSYFFPHILVYTYLAIVLYVHVVYLSYLMCNALLVVCSLYRTGLIKDLLLCSGYRDSSSLRPS